MEKDIKIVEMMLEGYKDVLASIEKKDPEAFEDPSFIRWALISSINFSCQLAKISGMDLEKFLSNVALTYGSPKIEILN